MNHSPIRPPLPLLAILAVSMTAQAAPISWGPATNTTGKSQLIEGQVLLAISGGTGATITAAGASGASTIAFTGVNYQDLTFAPAPGNRVSTDISNGTPGTGDANFDTVLKSITDTSASITSGTQTISGLTSGATYRIQVFFNDQRTSYNTRVMTYGDGASPAHTVDVAAAGSGWGQHAVGTFTASGSTQALTHVANGFANVHFNAILVVKDAVVPAPAVPAGLSAAPGNGVVYLDWDDNTQFGFSNFIVRRSSSPAGPYADIPGATPSTSNFTDTGLTNGTTYHYVVAAVNTLGQISQNSSSASATPAAGTAPPNFLFILTDDQNTYSLGAYRRTEPAEPGADGQPYEIDTPNMDRLAAEGMLFHSARIMGSWTAAVCTASRTCIMTGRSTWGAKTDYDGAGSAANTFPGIFNRGVRNGLPAMPYATYRTCKSGNSYPTANNEFTVVNDAVKRGNTDGNGSEWHADRALAYLDDWRTNHRPNGKPFFIQLGFSHPHDERLARTNPDLTGRYGCINTTDPAAITLNPLAPPLPFSHLSCTPATYPAHPFNFGNFTVRDENLVAGVGQYRTEAVVRNETGRDWACVDWIDRQLGRVLAKLEDPDGNGDTSDSVLDNTYIVYTSDHGIAVGRHGLMGKQNLYDHSWRVPYIVRGPGIAPGSETDALIYLHETFPTFCDLAGLVPPSTIDSDDGSSFRNVLEGNTGSHRDVLYGVYAGGDKPGIRAVTDGRFKLVKYDVAGNASQVTQLFDLEENPFELLPEHGVPYLATRTAYAGIRQRLEAALSQQRILNDDPYAFLGDRLLWRFEDLAPGSYAGTVADSLPFGRNGTAHSGNGGALPVFSAETPATTDYVTGQPNTRSLDFEQTNLDYVQVADARELDFGANPFTIEAWVKLESLPTGVNAASTMPVVMKRALAATDSNIDYMFLATAGVYGSATSYGRLALVLGSTTIVSSLAIPDTGWHHISVALDPVADVVRFTLDAQTDTKATTASGIANTGPLIIGAHFNASGVVDYAFDGLMDEISITNGFLAAAELQPLSAIPDQGPFKVESAAFEAGETITLTFESNENFLYDVQSSPDLSPSSWTTVRSFVPGATGAATTTVEGLPLPGPDRGFYRVVRHQGL